MVVTEMQAGVCGFRTVVRARSDDMQNVTLEIESTCEKISALAARLGPIDAYQEIGDGFDGVVLTAARVALPAPISITIERSYG